MSEPVLEIPGLDAYYGRAHVLHGLSTSTAAPTGVVGRNGMGKSTLCKAIMGITPPVRAGAGWTGRRSSAGRRTTSADAASATSPRDGASSRR